MPHGTRAILRWLRRLSFMAVLLLPVVFDPLSIIIPFLRRGRQGRKNQIRPLRRERPVGADMTGVSASTSPGSRGVAGRSGGAGAPAGTTAVFPWYSPFPAATLTGVIFPV